MDEKNKNMRLFYSRRKKIAFILISAVIFVCWEGVPSRSFASGFGGSTTAGEVPEAPIPEQFDELTVLLHAEAGAPFVGYMVAQNEGYYQEEGLPPIKFKHITSDLSGNREMRAGRAQFCTIWATRSIRCAALGDGCVSITQVMPRSTSGFVVRSDLHPNIRSIVDLEGCRIGIFFRGCEDAMTVLNMNKIDSETFFYQGNGLNLLRRNAVDAICYCSYSAAITLKSTKYRNNILFLPFADEGFNIPEDCITCTKSFLLKHPDICEKFVRATYRGWEKAEADNEKAMAAIQRDCEESGVFFNRKLVQQQFEEWKKLMDLVDSEKHRGILTREQFEQIMTTLKKSKLLDEERTLSYEEYFYPITIPETVLRIESERNASAQSKSEEGKP